MSWFVYLRTEEITVFADNHLLMLCMNDVIRLWSKFGNACAWLLDRKMFNVCFTKSDDSSLMQKWALPLVAAMWQNYFLSHFKNISIFPSPNRRENCTSCLEHSDECIWCESSQTCDQFAPYLAVNSYAQCKSWKENHQQEGMHHTAVLHYILWCHFLRFSWTIIWSI